MRVRLSPDTWALLALGAAVVLANLPYLLGFFHPDPLTYRSGLISAITHGPLTGKPTIDPSVGFTSQALGHRAALDLLHLHWPWWNPYAATGMPLLGEGQSAALFPPTLLTAFSNGQLYEHVLLELIAGICTYRLLRRIDISRSAALAGAIAFALNGKFAWFSDAGVNPLPFLPMLLLGLERAFAASRDGRRGGWRLIALAGALSAYAGFPEVAYIDVLVAVAWFGWRCACLERRALARFVIKTALGAGTGTLLAAPILVAMVSYLSHAALGIHAGSKLAGRHIPFYEAPQLLMPYVYGPLDSDPMSLIWIRVGGYLTSTLVLFAVLGLLAPGRRGLKLALVGCGLLVFARIYGTPPLLGHVIGVLPGMSQIQFFRYGTAALELPVIVLAALGLDDLTRVPAHRRRLFGAALAIIALVIAAALYARPALGALPPAFPHTAFFAASIAGAILIPVAAMAVVLLRSARARAALLAALVAVEAVTLFAVPEFSAPRASTVDLAPVAYLRRHLGEGRFFAFGPIQANYGSYFGLASVGVDDFPPEEYARYVRKQLNPVVAFTGFQPAHPTAEQELLRHIDGYRSVGVRYVLVRAGYPLAVSPATLRLVLQTPSTWIYRLTRPEPYFTARGCRVSSGNREAASVVCRRPTTLVRRETWLPGWSARIDGHSAPVRRIDRLFQAVTVPAGSHRVTFSFTPVGMNWALIAVLSGCVLLCAPSAAGAVTGLGWRRRGRRRSRRLSPSTG